MKLLLLKLILFVTLPLPLVLGAAWYFDTYARDEVYALWRQQRTFAEGDREIRYLILGNSRARRDLDAGQLPDAVTLTTPGESFVETCGHLRYVLERTDKRVDTVILPCGLATFKPMDFRRSYYWCRFVNFPDVGWRNGQPLAYSARYLEAYFFPYKAYLQARFSQWAAEATGMTRRRAALDREHGDYSTYDEGLQRQLREADVALLSRVGLLDRAAVAELEEILGLLEEHDVAAVFVKFPLEARYRLALRELAERQGYPEGQIEALIQSSPHACLFDYERLFVDRPELFSDPHHLNHRGRRELTARFVEDLARAAPDRSADEPAD